MVRFRRRRFARRAPRGLFMVARNGRPGHEAWQVDQKIEACVSRYLAGHLRWEAAVVRLFMFTCVPWLPKCRHIQPILSIYF